MNQSEQQLEKALISLLSDSGYEIITIKNEIDLLLNLKTQIECFNQLPTLSKNEWKQILSYLSKGSSAFECAKLLRDKCPIKFDDGSTRHIRFLSEQAEENIFQVTNQISVDNRANQRNHRFDVTILVNGLPLVQIELKRRGVEIAEAFHQTQRYIREAYWAGQGLFNYIQLFVISNGANTKYYSNQTKNIEFAFSWTNETNHKINELMHFAEVFLSQHHLIEMISQYMVILEDAKRLMVMRPYQIYAVKNIIKHIHTRADNGYIWHTTGSGKTLTAFKAAQLIMQMPDVEKVLFVVDRNDLDTQTVREFNRFKEGCVDTTTNTNTLVKQLGEKHDKLIVTTLQKLNRAVSTEGNQAKIAYLKDKKVVFIFDECHRSQFGETHRKIRAFFNKSQMFGFTGTPIFDDNSQSQAGLKLTTDYLFHNRLHQYVIMDAIRDENVLRFQIDYVGKFVQKRLIDSDVEVEAIDTQELFDNKPRIEKIARFIVENFDIKTRNREFTAMFCVSSVKMLTHYYAAFEKILAEKTELATKNGEHFADLKIATIFSYAANEAVSDGSGLIGEESTDLPAQINVSSRDHLDNYIEKYNRTFNTNFNSGERFYDYYRDIGQRVKNKEIDLLLVVNMFLTGFDAPTLNTLFVDKNLKYHGLIQAFSRTNRLYNDKKPFGNIVCFRNLKQATDDALSLFSNKDAKSIVLVPEFDEIKTEYNQAVEALLKITPTYESVDELLTEEDELEFIKAFRLVMRLNTQLLTFSEYNQDETFLNKLDYANFASKYIDLRRKVDKYVKKQKVSVLNDVDFQLELLHSDKINVGYILGLLQRATKTKNFEQRKQYEAQVYDLLATEITLQNKQDLIAKFIDQNMPHFDEKTNVNEAFQTYWDAERERAYNEFCEAENLNKTNVRALLENYQHTKRLPRQDEMKELPNFKVGLFQRESLFNSLVAKTRSFIERFYVGM